MNERNTNSKRCPKVSIPRISHLHDALVHLDTLGSDIAEGCHAAIQFHLRQVLFDDQGSFGQIVHLIDASELSAAPPPTSIAVLLQAPRDFCMTMIH